MDFSSLPFRQPAGLPFSGRARNRTPINRLLSYPQDPGTRQPLSGTDQAIKRGVKQGETKEKRSSRGALSTGYSSDKRSNTWSREVWEDWEQQEKIKGPGSCTDKHSKLLLHQNTCFGYGSPADSHQALGLYREAGQSKDGRNFSRLLCVAARSNSASSGHPAASWLREAQAPSAITFKRLFGDQKGAIKILLISNFKKKKKHRGRVNLPLGTDCHLEIVPLETAI